jgi:hypothetical protein
LTAEKSALNTRHSTQAVRAKVASTGSTESCSISNDILVIPASGDDGNSSLTKAVERDEEGSDDDAEKTLDSEEGAPNSSYANINMRTVLFSF